MSEQATVDDTGGTEAPPSRLLNLPVELQLIIYEMAVTNADPIKIIPRNDSDGERASRTHRIRLGITRVGENGTDSKLKEQQMQPAITRVNRSIRTDALPMYYKHNTFEVAYNSTLVQKWLQAIGPKNRASMAVVTVDGVDYREIFDMDYVVQHPFMGFVLSGAGQCLKIDRPGSFLEKTKEMLMTMGATIEEDTTKIFSHRIFPKIEEEG